jgi:WD40 repeat protein
MGTVAGADLLPNDCLAVTAAGLVHVWRSGVPKINDRREDHLILAGDAAGVTFAGHEGPLRYVAHTSDGRLLTAGNDGSFRIWDLADRRPVDLTQNLFGMAFDTQFTQAVLAPDGRFVVAAGNTGRIVVADLAAKNQAGTSRMLDGHKGAVHALVFATDGRLVSAGQDGTVRVWTAGPDGPTGPERVLSNHRGPVQALALAPDGRLASGSADGTVLVRDLSAGASASATSMLPVGKPVWRLAFASDGRLAAASGDGTGRAVQVWDLQNQEPGASSVRLLEGYMAITVLSFLSDGRLCVADHRGKVDFWGPRGASPERAVTVTTGPNYSVVPLPDGRVAMGGTGSVVLVLNLHDPEPLKTALTLRGHRSAVNALAWTSEGRLASGGRDGEVMLWNLNAPVGSQLVRIDSPGDEVHCLLNAPGDRIVAAGGNGKLKAWSTSVARLLAQAEAIVGRNLTKQEWDLYFPGQPYRPTFKTLPEIP